MIVVLPTPKLVRCVSLCQEDQPKEKRISSDSSGINDHQADATSTLKAPCKQKHSESLRNVSRTHFPPCTGQESPPSSTRVVLVDQEGRGAGAEGDGDDVS